MNDPLPSSFFGPEEQATPLYLRSPKPEDSKDTPHLHSSDAKNEEFPSFFVVHSRRLRRRSPSSPWWEITIVFLAVKPGQVAQWFDAFFSAANVQDILWRYIVGWLDIEVFALSKNPVIVFPLGCLSSGFDIVLICLWFRQDVQGSFLC